MVVNLHAKFEFLWLLYRNGVTNCKARPGADCGSDHNPVIAAMKIRLQKNRQKQMNTQRWNTKLLTEELICREFKEWSERKLEEVCDDADTEELWSAIKGSIEEVATEVLGNSSRKCPHLGHFLLPRSILTTIPVSQPYKVVLFQVKF